MIGTVSSQHIISLIGSKYKTALCSSCSEKGCIIHLSRMPPNIALKGERARDIRNGNSPSQIRICDYFIFSKMKSVHVSIIELKGRCQRASEIAEKIENSIDMTGEILRESNGQLSSEFLCVVVVARGWKIFERKKIPITLKHNGHTALIKCVESGKDLIDSIT